MEEDLEELEKTQILNRDLESEPSEAAAAKTARLPRLDTGAYRSAAAENS